MTDIMVHLEEDVSNWLAVAVSGVSGRSSSGSLGTAGPFHNVRNKQMKIKTNPNWIQIKLASQSNPQTISKEPFLQILIS